MSSTVQDLRADHAVVGRLRALDVPARYGVALWAVGILLALTGQFLIAPPRDFAVAWVLYAISAPLTVWGIRQIDRKSAWATAAPLSHSPRFARIPRPLLLLAGLLSSIGVALIGWSTISLLGMREDRLILGLWLLGLMLVLLAVALFSWSVPVIRAPTLTRSKVAEACALIAVLGIALVLRVPFLESVPPHIDDDESHFALETRWILQGATRNVFSFENYHYPRLSFALHAPAMAVFGDNLFGFRMAGAVQGVLSVLLLYLLTRRLFGPRQALFAGFLLAVNLFHLHFSRTGLTFIQGLVLTLVVLYFLVRALETRSYVSFLLSGYAVGLCLGAYYAARLAPVIAVTYLLHRAITEPGFLREHARGLFLLVFGALLFAGPMIAAYARSPESFMSRTNTVLVLSGENFGPNRRYGEQAPASVLISHIRVSLQAVNVGGDTSRQFMHRGPLADGLTAALAVLGLALVTVRARDARYFLIASWAWLILLVGSALTIDAPFTPRLLALTGPLAILPALVLDAGYRGLRDRFGRIGTSIGAAMILAALIFALGANHHGYFVVHGPQHQPPGRWVLMANYVAAINHEYRVLYFSEQPEASMDFQTVRLLVPRLDGGDARRILSPLPRDYIPDAKGIAFIIENAARDHDHRVGELRERYPSGRLEQHFHWSGSRHFTSYLVSRDDLLAQSAAPTSR